MVPPVKIVKMSVRAVADESNWSAQLRTLWAFIIPISHCAMVKKDRIVRHHAPDRLQMSQSGNRFVQGGICQMGVLTPRLKELMKICVAAGAWVVQTTAVPLSQMLEEILFRSVLSFRKLDHF